MSLRKTGILFAILVALCVGYWLMVHLEKRGRVKQREAQRLFAFAPVDIAAIEVHRMGEKPVAATREPGASWRIEKPNVTIEANQVLWDRMAKAFAETVNERTIDPSPSDLAQYGLDEPVLTIVAQETGGERLDLSFGAIEATQTCRYARMNEGPAFLVLAKTFQELDRPLGLLRYPYVFTVGEQGITRIEYARFWVGPEDAAPPEEAQEGARASRRIGEESVVVAVERSEAGLWRMVSPIKAEANQELIGELVKELQYAVGANYIDEPEDLHDYGLDPPGARITVYAGANGEAQTLHLGSLESKGDAEQGGLFVKRASRPAVFVISPQILTLLPKTPDGFREARLLSHAVTDLRAIHYESREAEFTLDSDPERGWQLAKPEVFDTDQEAVSNFLGALKLLKGHGFPGEPTPAYGLDDPTIRLTLAFKDDRPSATILVGGDVADTGQHYAMQDNGVVTLLNPTEVSVLTRSLFDFRSKRLLDFRKELASRIALEFEGVGYVLEKGHGRWRIKEPAERTLESESDVVALLDTLYGAKAVAMEADAMPADLAPYGLDDPLAVVTIAISGDEGAEAEQTVGPLKIGKTTPEDSQQRFAMAGGRAGVYRVRQAVVDEIRETLKAIR